MFVAVESDVFPAGGGGWLESCDFGGWAFCFDAHFFGELANGRCFVGFAGIEMTRNTGVPHARVSILEHRALLQQQIAAFVENQDMHRAVQQPLRMHFATRGLAGDLIMFIDNIKNLARLLRQVLERMGVAGAGERDPFCEIEFFRAGGGWHAKIL